MTGDQAKDWDLQLSAKPDQDQGVQYFTHQAGIRSLLDCEQYYTWTDTKDSSRMQIPLPEWKATWQSVTPKGMWALEAAAQPELINKY